MSAKEEFIEIYRANVHREGADALLDYLENKSDFFTSPASARYHGAYVGGLCEHSVNVYHCLREYLPCSMTCARSAATRRAPAM